MTSALTTAPIFVVGAGRSGTALLQSVLGAHPRIVAPPEMHFFNRIAGHSDIWGDFPDEASLRAVVAETVRPGRFADCHFDVDRIVAELAPGRRRYADVLEAIMRDYVCTESKARWSEKTPLQAPSLIWRHFPTAQVVHIVRDPFDTIASNLRKTGVWPDATIAAIEWRRFTTAAMRAGERQGPGQYLRIRYEDLATNPDETMRVVCSFLGEAYDPRMVTDPERRARYVGTRMNAMNERVVAPIDASAVGGAQQLLSRADQARVAAVVAGVAPALGYARPSIGTRITGQLLNLPRWPGWLIMVGRRTAIVKWGSGEVQRKEAIRLHQKQVGRRASSRTSR